MATRSRRRTSYEYLHELSVLCGGRRVPRGHGEGGLRTVLLDFFTTTKCQEVYDPAGGSTKEEGFEANFGIRSPRSTPTSTHGSPTAATVPRTFLPTRAAVKALFSHCTVCADLCDSGAGNNYNGNCACDGACSPFGSDCTDCAPHGPRSSQLRLLTTTTSVTDARWRR